MNAPRPAALLILLAVLGTAPSRTAETPGAAVPVVRTNDNRVAAGQLDHDTLRLRLVMQMSDWYAESDTGPALRRAMTQQDHLGPTALAQMTYRFRRVLPLFRPPTA